MEVSDTGAGIPAADLSRIFERFYQVDRARSRPTGAVAGTGLGLALVKHVAETHGGRVDVESRLGEGSTFRVFLPTAPTGESVRSGHGRHVTETHQDDVLAVR